MLTADDFWAAVDMLALRHGMSLSALAVHSGVDETTLCRSKRVIAGRKRWPTMATVSLLLEATRTTPEQWARDVEEAHQARMAREVQAMLSKAA